MKPVIAILGSNGLIAKSIIHYLLSENKEKLILFSRYPDNVESFLRKNNLNCGKEQAIIRSLCDFPSNDQFDLVINATGITSKDDIENAPAQFIKSHEEIDSMIISSLEKNSKKIYVNISSGAVYGKDFSNPIDDNRSVTFDFSKKEKMDIYSMMKIYLEAKHRALSHLNIVDLRIFSYFSRHISIDSHFFLAQILSSIESKQTFITNDEEIYRDYLHPEDLVQMIRIILNKENINDFYDLYSRETISKSEILELFQKKYNLNIEKKCTYHSINSKKYYFTTSRKAAISGYIPKYSSMETIKKEIAYMNKTGINKKY